MNVVYALYDAVICNDSSTIEEIGVTPFSSIYMCSDLYEIVVELCDGSSATLFKHYYTPFQSVIEDLAVVEI